MKAIKRNLWYWGRLFENLTGSMLLGILVYMVVMSVLDGEASFEYLGGKVIAFSGVFICIATFATALQALNTNFPLTISMGSTRKSSFIGMQIMLHVVMAQWLLLGALVCCFLEAEIRAILAQAAIGIIGFVTLLIMLANLMCVVAAKFGKEVGVIVYIFGMVCVIGVIVAGLARGILGDEIGGVLEWFSQPFLLLIGIVGDAIVIFVYYKVILRCNF